MNAPPPADEPVLESDQVFDQAADLFRLMSAPMRLKIISSLCNSEKNVGQLLQEIHTTQPNMSQHLNTLHTAGVLGRRREGVQIFYRIVDERAAQLCRAVCMQIAIDADGETSVGSGRESPGATV
ncbi:MAG: hypothetical protein RLZZ126_949 [Pseudomonadota bacterium]|jgi:DNA-binding transcriptional ArsR family regulator